MSYFTAVLSRSEGAWHVHDIEVDDVDADTLVDELRMVGDGDDPVLFLIEREDEWWGILRIDGEDDPRVFVSDIEGAQRSQFADVLVVDAVPVNDDDEVTLTAGCGGDFDVLVDLGTDADRLRDLCDDGLLPMDAMAGIAESGGFAEVLDSLR